MSTSALIDALKPFAEMALPEDSSPRPSLPLFADIRAARAARAAIQEAEAPVPESDARQQARAQVESIVALVAALNCDYDRLEELREERSDWLLNEGYATSIDEWEKAHPTEAEELAGLIEAAGDCTSREQAEDRIREDALSVDVRSGWQTAGETLEPSEFRIVLCTGGPHVEIRGELDANNEPSRAWIEYCDWSDSGELVGCYEPATLLAYAACFYFGE